MLDVPTKYLEVNTTVHIGCEVGRVKPSIDTMEWLLDSDVIGSTNNWTNISNGDGTYKQIGTLDMDVLMGYHEKQLKCKVSAFNNQYESEETAVNVGCEYLLIPYLLK